MVTGNGLVQSGESEKAGERVTDEGCANDAH